MTVAQMLCGFRKYTYMYLPLRRVRGNSRGMGILKTRNFLRVGFQTNNPSVGEVWIRGFTNVHVSVGWQLVFTGRQTNLI